MTPVLSPTVSAFQQRIELLDGYLVRYADESPNLWSSLLPPRKCNKNRGIFSPFKVFHALLDCWSDRWYSYPALWCSSWSCWVCLRESQRSVVMLHFSAYALLNIIGVGVVMGWQYNGGNYRKVHFWLGWIGKTFLTQYCGWAELFLTENELWPEF